MKYLTLHTQKTHLSLHNPFVFMSSYAWVGMGYKVWKKPKREMGAHISHSSLHSFEWTWID
jgi:hypothetical protein